MNRRREWLADEPSGGEPDFAAPEPLPRDDPVHDPAGFARAFWQRWGASVKPPEPPGRPPKGDLSPEHERFRVLDGGKAPEGDGDNDP
jgi:hypothetical protein